MPAAVFVTASPQAFGDNLLIHNDAIAIENGIVTLAVRGQATGKDDPLIKAAIEEDDIIHVFWRRNDKRAFIYYGVADSARVLVAREGERGVAVPVQHRNLFRFETESRRAMQLPFRRLDDRKVGCCKRVALAHVGAPINVNHMKSFYRW